MDLEHSAGRPRGLQGTLRGAAGAVLVALALAGCGTKPFVDGRREAGQIAPVGASTPDRVAICYSSHSSTPAEILALANTECAKTARTAQFDGQQDFQCALLAPTRAFFKCVAKP